MSVHTIELTDPTTQDVHAVSGTDPDTVQARFEQLALDLFGDPDTGAPPGD